MVGAVTDGQSDAGGDCWLVEGRGDVRGACAPVVADKRVTSESECAREIDQVLPEGHQLATTKGVVVQEARRPVTAQPGTIGAKAGGVQRGQHAVPGPNIIRPTMHQHDGETVIGAARFVRDAQERRIDRWHGSHSIT